MTRGYESHSFGITQLINDNHIYNCTCEATWEVKGDTILNPHVHGDVEKVFSSDSGSSASYINVTNQTPIIGRSFSFSGKVVYKYTGFNIGYLDVTFNVSGTCGNENRVVWTL